MIDYDFNDINDLIYKVNGKWVFPLSLFTYVFLSFSFVLFIFIILQYIKLSQ